MKRWHTNKTRPKTYEDFIVIWKDGTITLDMLGLDDFGKNYFIGDPLGGSWNDLKDGVKFWAYTRKYFEKELKWMIHI